MFGTNKKLDKQQLSMSRVSGLSCLHYSANIKKKLWKYAVRLPKHEKCSII